MLIVSHHKRAPCARICIAAKRLSLKVNASIGFERRMRGSQLHADGGNLHVDRHVQAYDGGELNVTMPL